MSCPDWSSSIRSAGARRAPGKMIRMAWARRSERWIGFGRSSAPASHPLAHPSRDGGDNPRGHSSQDGAADAIWVMKDQDGSRILSCAKLKDGDESTEVRLALIQREGSVVLMPADKAGVQQSLTTGQLKVLATIHGIDHGTGVGASTIVDVSKVAKSSVHYILKNLKDAGLVAHKSYRWRLTSAGLVQSSKGCPVLSPALASMPSESPARASPGGPLCPPNWTVAQRAEEKRNSRPRDPRNSGMQDESVGSSSACRALGAKPR